MLIDSGSITEGLTVKEALKQYQEKIPPKWAKTNTGNCTQIHSALTQALAGLNKLKL